MASSATAPAASDSDAAGIPGVEGDVLILLTFKCSNLPKMDLLSPADPFVVGKSRATGSDKWSEAQVETWTMVDKTAAEYANAWDFYWRGGDRKETQLKLTVYDDDELNDSLFAPLNRPRRVMDCLGPLLMRDEPNAPNTNALYGRKKADKIGKFKFLVADLLAAPGRALACDLKKGGSIRVIATAVVPLEPLASGRGLKTIIPRTMPPQADLQGDGWAGSLIMDVPLVATIGEVTLQFRDKEPTERLLSYPHDLWMVLYRSHEVTQTGWTSKKQLFPVGCQFAVVGLPMTGEDKLRWPAIRVTGPEIPLLYLLIRASTANMLRLQQLG